LYPQMERELRSKLLAESKEGIVKVSQTRKTDVVAFR
jgi:hypothetical protein